MNQAQVQQPPVPPADNSQPNSRGKRPQQPKKPKQSVAIKAEHFQGPKGLKMLYQRTKALKLDSNSEVNVSSTMNKILVAMKTWQFEMTPKFSFDFFLQRCKKLGTSKQLMTYMSKVRRVHKGEDVWEVPVEGQVPQERPPEGQEEIYNKNSMHEQHNQAIVMMNNLSSALEGGQNDDMDEDDLELLAAMNRVVNKGKKEEEKEEYKEESEEPSDPYVPEGFGFNYSEEEN